MSRGAHSTVPATHWWLAKDDTAVGTYGQQEVLTAVRVGAVPRSTYAWPAGRQSVATDITPDRRVVVGSVTDAAGLRQAARWTSSGGWVSVVVALLVLVGGCDDPNAIHPKQELSYQNFPFNWKEGTWVSDDYFIQNKSSYDLHEVNISFVSHGINGDKKEIKQYWAYWTKGETKHIEIPLAESVSHPIQKVVIEGSTRKYYWGIESTLRPPSSPPPG
jgi:hypothetical protein